MSFRYLNQIAAPEHIGEFLQLADLAAGAGMDAHNVFELSRHLSDSKPMRLCTTRLRKDPDAARLIDERRLCGPYDLESLLQHPKGSLGHTYATVMRTLNYDINFFPNPAFFNNLASEADYINYRVFATHDIHHIVSGYSLDNFGETGVLSISIGPFSFPGFSFLNLVGLMVSFFACERPYEDLIDHTVPVGHVGYEYDLIQQGIAMGLKARPLFPVIWEERMGQNLEELRAELGIEPVREGPWSWSSHPAIRAALA